MRGLSLAVASGGHSSSRCAGLSLSWPLPLRSTGSRRAGSAIVAHGPSRSAARGILPDQGSNPRPLHRQADSQPLRHQGSPRLNFFKNIYHLCRSMCPQPTGTPHTVFTQVVRVKAESLLGLPPRPKEEDVTLGTGRRFPVLPRMKNGEILTYSSV